eukprot:gene7809-biopygen17579
MDSDLTGRMTLVSVQESGLELGTAPEDAQHSPEIGLIPYLYIPSPCVVLLLAAMDSETRQAFRAVSKSCRQSVHAFTTTLRSSSKRNGPRQSGESIAIPKCPNVRSLEIHHFPGSCRNLQTLDVSHCKELGDVSALSLCPHLQNLAVVGCSKLVDVSTLIFRPNLQKITFQLEQIRHIRSSPASTKAATMRNAPYDDAYTNNAARALRYIRKDWGQGFTSMPHFYKGVNPYYDSFTTLTHPFCDIYPASAQDAALPPSTPVHQPPSSPSDNDESTGPPTPTSDGEPSDLRAFQDAAAAADLLRKAIPMLSKFGINYEVDDPVPPKDRPANPLQGLVQTVEDMGTMSQDALTPARLLPHWNLHPKILEMILEMAKTPPIELHYKHGDGLVCYTTGLECSVSSDSGLYTTSLYQPSPSGHPYNDLPDDPWHPRKQISKVSSKVS